MVLVSWMSAGKKLIGRPELRASGILPGRPPHPRDRGPL